MGKHSPPLWLSECSSKTWTRYLRTLKNTRQARIEDQRIQYMYRWTGDELPIFPPVSTNLDTRQPESQKREPNVQKAHPWLWLCCSVTQLCLTLFDPMDCMPGFPVLHYLLEFAQTHVHWVKDEVQPSHPLLSLSPPTFNLSWHQGLSKWVTFSWCTLHICQISKVTIYSLDILLSWFGTSLLHHLYLSRNFFDSSKLSNVL